MSTMNTIDIYCLSYIILFCVLCLFDNGCSSFPFICTCNCWFCPLSFDWK